MIADGDTVFRARVAVALLALTVVIVPGGSLHGRSRTLDLLAAGVSDSQAAVAASALTGFTFEQATHQRVAPKTTPHLPGEVFAY